MVKIEGEVIQGRQLGRQLGFPTANVALNESVDCPDGVYLSEVRCAGNCWQAITNLGSNPTVGGCHRRLESHLLDYDGPSLYGSWVEITLLAFLRAERHFESLLELQAQILRDVRSAREAFKTLKIANRQKQ